MNITHRHISCCPVDKIALPTRMMFGFFSFRVLVAITIFISSSMLLPIEANSGGFTVNIIHRDAPESPFYNNILTPFQHLNNAFRRSEQRSKQFVSTDLIPNGGEYLMKISYGTPPFESLALVDTGSHLVWVQCLPCFNCYKEKFPPFDPKTSSTFHFVYRSSRECPNLLPKNQSSKQDPTPCHYRIGYGDGSYSNGDLATETITFGSSSAKMSFPNFIFGCGHDNGGGFSQMESGLVGLGPQKLSLVSQLSSSIGSKFSYCLVPLTEHSKPGQLSFGDQAVVSGPGVVSTPLVINSYYSLVINSISVESNSVNFVDTPFSSNGSSNSEEESFIIIDSGTTLTYLPPHVYTKFEDMVRSHIGSNNTISDPQGFFSLCYSWLSDAEIPDITFHFKGAALKLNALNTFVRNTRSSICLAFTSSNDISIFGNIAHSNFLVGYDLLKKSVSFKPMECATLSK